MSSGFALIKVMKKSLKKIIVSTTLCAAFTTTAQAAAEFQYYVYPVGGITGISQSALGGERSEAKYGGMIDEKYADIKDYTKLKYWYRKYYPEMFDFDGLGQRVKLYELIDTLHLLLDWPNNNELHTKLNKLLPSNS